MTLGQGSPEPIVAERPAARFAPAFERLRSGKRPRFALQGIEIMIEIENLLPARVAALVARHACTLVLDFDMRRQHPYASLEADRERRRIPIRAHANTTLAVNSGEAFLGQRETLRGERAQMFTLDAMPAPTLWVRLPIMRAWSAWHDNSNCRFSSSKSRASGIGTQWLRRK